MDQDTPHSPDAAAHDEGRLLREHLFEGELLHLPPPEEANGFLPGWYTGPLPALVYPPLAERGFAPGESIQLQVTHYHVYYGALRELAETADAERAGMLRRLVLEWNPHAALEVCELARMRIEQDVESAFLHYELALELDDRLYEAAQDGGMCQYALANLVAEGREEALETAEELFRRAIELRPSAGLSWWSLARVLHDRGDPEGSATLLRQFLEEYPEGSDREMVEDALYHGFGDGSGTDQQTLFSQAQLLMANGQPEQAVELLRPLADTYPDEPFLWFQLGTAYRRSGDASEAERCLRRAARLAPGEPFVWWELARASMELEAWRPAEEALRKALEFDPDNALFHADLARTLARLGDREGAQEAIQRARELAGDDPEVRAAAAEVGA